MDCFPEGKSLQIDCFFFLMGYPKKGTEMLFSELSQLLVAHGVQIVYGTGRPDPADW